MRLLHKKDKKNYIRRGKIKHIHELKRKAKRLRLKKRLLLDTIGNKRVKNSYKYNKSTHETHTAPITLSLTEDPVATIKYFEKAKEALQRNTPVYFDLRSVNKMGPETLTYFCALINDIKYTGGTPLKGNLPSNPTLCEMFDKTGFYNFVQTPASPGNYKNSLVHRITKRKVESQLAGDICKSAMKHTFNTDDYTKQNFYPILIECMANTFNHANYGNKEAIYNWWLLAYKEPNTKITKFCFLDLGIGIFESLRKKHEDNGLTERLKRLVIPTNNQKTLTKILKGEKKTSTNLPGRGLGLNNIYTLVKERNSKIKNFTLLSNDIIARIEYNTVDRIQTINHNFEGTMYYWELTPKYEK